MKFTYNPKDGSIWEQPATAEDCLLNIIHLAADYDGRRTKKDLKKLIDELRALADTGLTLGITEGKWETNLYEESESYEKAKAEREVAQQEKE